MSKATLLSFQLLMLLRPVVRLANIGYGFYYLATRMHSPKDFLPFSSRVVEAVQHFMFLLVGLLVTQVSSLFLDLYLDGLEIRYCKSSKLVSLPPGFSFHFVLLSKTYDARTQDSVVVDGLPSSSSPFKPRIIVDHYEDESLLSATFGSPFDSSPYNYEMDSFATPRLSSSGGSSLLSVPPRSSFSRGGPKRYEVNVCQVYRYLLNHISDANDANIFRYPRPHTRDER